MLNSVSRKRLSSLSDDTFLKRVLLRAIFGTFVRQRADSDFFACLLSFYVSCYKGLVAYLYMEAQSVLALSVFQCRSLKYVSPFKSFAFIDVSQLQK